VKEGLAKRRRMKGSLEEGGGRTPANGWRVEEEQ
jgi:hypothetical protein